MIPLHLPSTSTIGSNICCLVRPVIFAFLFLSVHISPNVIVRAQLSSSFTLSPFNVDTSNNDQFVDSLPSNLSINLTDETVVHESTTHANVLSIGEESVTQLSPIETETNSDEHVEHVPITTIYPSHYVIDPEPPCDGDHHCPDNSHCHKSTCKCSIGHCAHNATCLVTNAEVLCLCQSGFNGHRCEYIDQPCGKLTCQNGGSCIEDGKNQTKCLCTSGTCSYVCVCMRPPGYHTCLLKAYFCTFNILIIFQ